MRRRIEALLYGRRWRADEHAWGVWQNLAPLVPSSFFALDSGRPIAGRVYRVYQQARRGTKAVVHFGDAVGPQDTWWEHMRPAANQWVVVRTHLWLPPGTHSGQQVVWIDAWESWAAGDVSWRAQRHERRQEKEGLRTTPPHEGGDIARVMDLAALPAQPLFCYSVFAAPVDVDEAMAATAEIAAEMDARTYGPAELPGGHLLFLWPRQETPTSLSVTARPISDATAWVGVDAQSLSVPSLDVAKEIESALEQRLGSLGPGISPPPRETDYDRGATRRLEAEIQELLEAVALDPGSWERVSGSIYERELLLQGLAGLRA